MCGPFLPCTAPGYTALLRLAKLLEPGPRASTGGPCAGLQELIVRLRYRQYHLPGDVSHPDTSKKYKT
jgi:hypothetical protein